MRTVLLQPCEIAALDRQDPSTEADGGWQSLLVRLQAKLQRSTGCIDLDARDLEQIPRYDVDYGNGG